MTSSFYCVICNRIHKKGTLIGERHYKEISNASKIFLNRISSEENEMEIKRRTTYNLRKQRKEERIYRNLAKGINAASKFLRGRQ